MARTYAQWAVLPFLFILSFQLLFLLWLLFSAFPLIFEFLLSLCFSSSFKVCLSCVSILFLACLKGVGYHCSTPTKCRLLSSASFVVFFEYFLEPRWLWLAACSGWKCGLFMPEAAGDDSEPRVCFIRCNPETSVETQSALFCIASAKTSVIAFWRMNTTWGYGAAQKK